MRDVLFRGKRKDNGEWVEGSLLYDGEQNEAYIAECFEDRSAYIREAIPETVGQYTGLTDKNGKMIFEGDIIEFEAHGYIPSVERGCVIFKDGCYGIEFVSEIGKKLEYGKQFHRIGMESKWQDMGASGTITYTYEIIGNIHDNPEVLKGGNNGE